MLNPPFWLSVMALFAVSTTGTTASQNYVEFPACRLAKAVQDSGEEMQRIVAVGDVHGEFNGFKEILRSAGIIDGEQCVWKHQTGKGTLLVQVGDIVDRGPDAIGAWNCISDLQQKAPEGSSVIRLVGNHEMWWLNGQTHDRNKKYDTKDVITEIVTELKDAIVSGDVQAAFTRVLHGVNILFVHAGFRKDFVDSVLPVGFQGNEALFLTQYTNKQLKRETNKCMRGNGLFCSIQGETFDAGPERGGRSIGGPFWTDFSVVYQEQNSAPSGYTIQVVGHTASRYHEIRSSYGLTSICVDSGMYFGGRSFFEIGSDGRFRVFKATGGPPTKSDVFDLTEQTCFRSSADL